MVRSIAFMTIALVFAAAATAGVVQVGFIETVETVNDMVLVGETAYLAGGEAGLFIFDLSAPAQPLLLDSYVTGDRFRGVAVDGDRVFLVGGGQLRILDASDPTNITLVGSVTLGVANKVAIQADHAYVACGYLGLKIVDISDPTQPFEVGRFDAPTDLHSIAVAVEGDHAYVTNADLGGYPLFIIDVSDPADPWLPGWFYTSASHATVVRDGLTYTADENVFITDVSDPSDPQRVGTAHALRGYDIELVGDLAYVSCFLDGLAIVDVGDPTTPRTVGGFYTGESALAVAADGDLVLLSNHDKDVWILAVDPTTATPVPDVGAPAIAARPNPFNPRTSLRLDLPRAGPTRLAIHDIRGRRVRTLFDGDLAAGRHDVAWDGTDAGGRAVPAGVYIAVLHSDAGRAVARLGLVK